MLRRSLRRPPLRDIHLRSSSTVVPDLSGSIKTQEGWVFVDSVFPIQLARWDIRHYIGLFREETLLSNLQVRLSAVKTHGFEILDVKPHRKDGGVFVRFRYNASDENTALESIEQDLQAESKKQNGLPSWLGFRGGHVWLVKGSPWLEDMNRYASSILKVSFDGPDVPEQKLYDLFRNYGRIQNISPPSPVPAGNLRYTTIHYQHVRSATTARNVMHGASLESRLRTAYEQPIQAHVIRNWLSSHPKIVLPVIVFLLGTLTYTVFDPIRSLMIQGKMLDWFDVREFTLYKWIRANTFDRLSFTDASASSVFSVEGEQVWKEREDAEASMKNYLNDLPVTIAFVHGPQGSGKFRLLQDVMKQHEGRNMLVIDCRELQKSASESQLVSNLAKQTGYWPVFTFLNSMNNMIDLASVGVIGQKAGLSASLTDQLEQVLSVVTDALTSVSSNHRQAIQKKVKEQELQKLRAQQEEDRKERLKRGIWHDGRLDCVAGNGVMSELGIGDEILGEWDSNSVVVVSDKRESANRNDEKGGDGPHVHDSLSEEGKPKEKERERRQKSAEDIQAVESLPLVVIRNFEIKGGGKEEVLSVLSKWAAGLMEAQLAHIVVISDNRENSKRIAKALPSRPLNSIPLYDADSGSALSYVKQKLRDAGIDLEYNELRTKAVERLGGRASDLDSLIHKVRAGQDVDEAVEDIINRGVSELRQNAFGDETDASLSWSREQAWAVLKRLSKKGEVPYHDVLIDFPFKGDETALRSMEHAELISIATVNGRPASIKPGKPVYKFVFERLVEDPVFRANQEIAYNTKIITSCESTIKACEQELKDLRDIAGSTGDPSTKWFGGKSGVQERSAYLFEKMLQSEVKLERAEKQNTEWRKVLAKGG